VGVTVVVPCPCAGPAWPEAAGAPAPSAAPGALALVASTFWTLAPVLAGAEVLAGEEVVAEETPPPGAPRGDGASEPVCGAPSEALADTPRVDAPEAGETAGASSGPALCPAARAIASSEAGLETGAEAEPPVDGEGGGALETGAGEPPWAGVLAAGSASALGAAAADEDGAPVAALPAGADELADAEALVAPAAPEGPALASDPAARSLRRAADLSLPLASALLC